MCRAWSLLPGSHVLLLAHYLHASVRGDLGFVAINDTVSQPDIRGALLTGRDGEKERERGGREHKEGGIVGVRAGGKMSLQVERKPSVI